MGLTCFKSWKFDSAAQKGNRDVLVSPGSYFFLSNSCGQGEEWLKSLNKGVWIPFTGVFGQRLEETVLYERRYGDHMAPLVVEQCVDFIRERGLLEVGLFRQPGQATLVKELQEAFDAGEKPSFDSTDVHTVASLLKLYLRELPEPLVPFSRYQEFLMCGKKMPSDREQGLLELKTLLHELPVANFNLLKYICQFLNEVQSYSSTNKMSIQNLATVFGPNILRPKAEDPESIIGGAAVVQHLMSELIREHTMLFSRENRCSPPGTSVPAFVPTHRQHDRVEWVYTEPSAHPSEHQLRMGSDRLAQPAATSTSCLRKLSLPLTTERRPSRQSSRAQRHLSESQQWQPEASSPTSSCLLYENHSPSLSARAFPHTALVPPTMPPTASSSTTAVSDTRDGSRAPSRSWPAQGQSGWEAERAFRDSVGSSEAQESTLSVYDNMGPEGRVAGCAGDGQAHGGAGDLEGCAGSMADSSSSWSSCEILLTEGGNICKRAASPCHSPLYFPSFRSDPEEGDRHPDSPAPSSAPTDAPLSTGSSDVFLPNAPPDPAASQSMQCVLVGLRQQMARQKAEYESKINRLELQKEALQGQVSGLHTTLEQQRQWISMAEIKMRNVERARADADRRNATLQQEMEQFFHTFGELNSEARKTERIAQSF
ncbi:rho GTPase-activating protein 24 isoform X2 [Electrophorus electricus]|uniref:rho GTPase-activating protein 24 isoform X2 n=1 Tax=Electrophorus electricus TaxID=8005 RepID=UPI0015D0BDCF|nr:rho GTPase-activating protein 24 isoform X2 [Electrophorus electricus]